MFLSKIENYKNSISISVNNNGDEIIVTLKVKDSHLLNLPALFHIEFKVTYPKKKWAQKYNKTLFSKNINFLQKEVAIAVPCSTINKYSYDGSCISTSIDFCLDISLRNSNIIKIVKQPLPVKKLSIVNQERSKPILNPKDKFNLITNLKVLTGIHQTKAFIYTIIGLIMIFTIIAIGIHDQYVQPYGEYILFPEGDGPKYGKGPIINYPIVQAISAFFFIFIIIWHFTKKKLQAYIKPKIQWPKIIDKNSIIYPKDLIDGLITSNISQITVKVVAGNREKCDYFDWFAPHAIYGRRRIKGVNNAIVLYEKTIPYISKGQQLSEYFDNDEFTIKRAFNKILPTMKFGKRNGIYSCIEIQIIHDKIIDHLITIPEGIIQHSNFKIL